MAVPSGMQVLWELTDPDDTTDEAPGLTDEARQKLDPNRDSPDGDSGNDNMGKVESGLFERMGLPNHYFEESVDFPIVSGTLEPAGIPTCNLLVGPEHDQKHSARVRTQVVDQLSEVIVHVTDRGGDNFRLRARVKFKPDGELSGGDQTGTMTVWKRLDIEYNWMIEGKGLPMDQIQKHFNPAYVEWHVHNEGVTEASPEYLGEGEVAYAAYCDEEFDHAGEAQWVFVCSARKLSSETDYDPATIYVQSKASIVGEFELRDDSKDFGPEEHKGRHIIVNPAEEERYFFTISHMTGQEIHVYPIDYRSPLDAPKGWLSLGNAPGLGILTEVTYWISEGGVTGQASDEPPSAFVFYETWQNLIAEQDPPPAIDTKTINTLVHELMHTFSLKDMCGNRDVRGNNCCVGHYAMHPVLLGGQYLRLPGGPDFCWEHLNAIRAADGFRRAP